MATLHAAADPMMISIPGQTRERSVEDDDVARVAYGNAKASRDKRRTQN